MKYRARAMAILLVLVACVFTERAFGLTPHEEFAPATVFDWEAKTRDPASTRPLGEYDEEFSPYQVFKWEWNDRMPSSMVDKKVNYRELEEFSPENVFKY